MAEQLHQPDAEAKKPAGFALDHVYVLIFGGTNKTITPINVHALSMVQFFELFGKNSRRIRNGFGWEFSDYFVEGQKVNVISRINCRRNAVNCVCTRNATPQNGIIFNVIYTGGRKITKFTEFYVMTMYGLAKEKYEKGNFQTQKFVRLLKYLSRY